MQGDSTIATGRAHPRIHRRTLVAKIFNELESKQIAVETESALYVLHVNHGVVESKLPGRIRGDGSLSSCPPGPLGSKFLCGARSCRVLRRDFSCFWLRHKVVR